MTEQPTAGAGAVRLIFEYEGDTVRLVSQQPVDTVITAPIAAEQRAGHFVETRTAAGDLLARVAVPNGPQQSTEVFPEDHSEPITRVDEAEPRGAFTVVVPAHADAASVAVVRIPPGRLGVARPGRFFPPRSTEAHVELGTFRLQQEG